MEKISKHERQNHIIIKLKNNPDITQSELSHQLKVHKATISRDFVELSLKGALLDSGNRISINKNYYIDDVQLTLNEAFTLYTSASLLVDRTDFVNPDLITALRKISESLQKSKPHISSLLRTIANKNELESKDNLYTENLTKIISAWTMEQQIKISYLSRRDQILKK